MPVTVRYSAALDRTYEDGDLPQPPASPLTTDSGSGSSTPASFRTQPSPAAGDDFGSVDSLDAESLGSGNHSRQVSADSTEFIPTRTVKSNVRPAFNPLQFVKTGKSKLVRTAEQQIKQCEEVKKVKERVREDEEAWQSNLDNWKSKRRQISHKTIQKAEEIKQIEEVELERQRKKSKTFNEMMEERTKRGTSSALPAYGEWGSENEEGGTSDESAAARGDASFDSSGSERLFREAKFAASTPMRKATNGNGNVQRDPATGQQQKRDRKGSPENTNGHSDLSLTSDEPEYTFDKAIQSYAQFAESRLKHPSGDEGRKGAPAVKTGHWGQGEPRSSSPKKTVVAAEEDDHVQKMERASGQRLSVVVNLRRGGESKEFGFGIKSVRGFGTGIFVENVHSQSPAESSGLMVNDEILAINGEFCTSKRTHSAIVFAVKQAVYTGNLELEIYRYDDTDQIRPCRSPTSRASVPRTKKPLSSLDRSSSETVLHQQQQQPPKVDLVKRRSVFEASSRASPERTQNRRSLDVSARIKDRLASFENGGSGEGPAADHGLRSQKRASAFQEKLASFRSLDSLNRSEPGRDSAKEPAVVEDLDVRTFERTRSCEFLDLDEEEGSEPRGYASDRQFETDLSELRALVTLADRQDPEDVRGRYEAPEARRKEEVQWPENDREGVLGSPLLHRGEAVLEETQLVLKSGFELAESLEETPITGSAPSSPRESNASVEMGLGFRPEAETSLGSMDEVDLGSQLENLDLSGDIFVVDHVDPPLKTLEPPKEKPPPPPVDHSENGKKNQVEPDVLRRVDSTKRIRTEIWKRRSDFLGIDGEDVQKLMQHEMDSVTPPPTLENLLREDLFGHGRKEGVKPEELDTSQEGEARYEDTKEMSRKEREIIESLEWEERLMQKRSGEDGSDEDFDANVHQREPEPMLADEPLFERTLDRDDFAVPLTEDEQPQFYPDPDLTLKMREAELQRQEELLRLEKEKLRQEQEELLRQKQAYQKRIEDHQRGNPPVAVTSPAKDVRPSASPIYETIPPPPALLSQEGRPKSAAAAQPPPPPTKPKVVSPVFNDRIYPSSETAPEPADQRPSHPRVPDDLRPRPEQQPSLQPLTKQALYALSASPKVKLMDGDQWMARRKANGQPRRDNYNQHWLVQEAEFRRLHPQEQQQKLQQLQQQQQQQLQQQQLLQHQESSGWKSPPTNGIYSSAEPSSRPPVRQPQRPAETPYAVPLHRQPQQERRQPDAEPQPQTARAQPPPPHPPKPGQKPAAADREPSSASQMLSVSGKKKCSHCAEELGRGAAMIIESLQLFYHINCFKCCVCHIQLGNGSSGADVRVRSQKLHCHNCYSNDEGLKFSKV